MISFLFPFLVMFSNPTNIETTCPQPSNLHVTSNNGGSISFDWDDCGCATGAIYKVQYLRLADSYLSPTYPATSSDFGFSNLQSGNYEFYFWTDCGGGDASEAIVIEDLVEN